MSAPVASKRWWLSKTIWINVLASLVEVLSALRYLPGSEKLQEYVPFTAFVLNVLIRLVTHQPIAGSPADKS